MAFQGFAREEDFSTNQIKIDIGSVVDNDLAEASRMSKFMERNTKMGEKWRDMYLDALIGKHEVEKQNREKNFKFFMDNRKAIQKQIEYNNEVELKDAEREDPHIPGLGEILGEALMKMAVDVGAQQIQKWGARSKEAKKKAEAEKKQNTLGRMSRYQLQANDAVNKKISGSSDAINELRKQGADGEKDLEKLVVELHKLDPNISVDEHRSYLRDRLSLDQITAQGVAHDPTIIGPAYQEHLDTFVYNHPTAGKINSDQVSGAKVNRSLSAEWREAAQNSFFEQYNILSKVGSVQGSVVETMRKVESQFTHHENNNRRKLAALETRRSYMGTAQIINNTGPDGLNNTVNYFISTDREISQGGPSYISGSRIQGFDLLEDFALNSLSLGEVDKIMGGIPALNNRNLFEEDSERGRIWRKIRSQKINEDMNQLGDLKKTQTLLGAQWLARLQGPGVDPQEYQQIVDAAAAAPGVDNEIKTTLSQIPQEYRKEIIKAALTGSGRNDKPEVADPSADFVNKAFTAGDRNDIIKSVTLEVSETMENKEGVKRLINEDSYLAKSTITSWLSTVRDDIDPDGLLSEAQFQQKVRDKILDKGDHHRAQLFHALTPKTFIMKPDGSKKFLKKATWPFLTTIISDVPNTATGISQLETIISQGNGVLNIDKVTSNEVIIEAITPWMNDIHKAQEAGRDISQLLANPPAVLTKLGQRIKNGSSSQAANYFIRDHFDHMKPLSGNNLFTQEEVQEMNQRVTGWSKMGSQANSYFLQAQGTPGGGITPRYQTPASSATPGVRAPQGYITYESNPGLYKGIGDWATDIGLTVGGHPLFTGKDGTNRHDDPVHSPTGHHPGGTGFDFTHWGASYEESMRITRKVHQAFLHWKKIGLVKQVYGPGDRGHDTHVDVGGFTREPTPQEKRWFEEFTGLRSSTGVHGNYMQSNPRFR